MKALLRGGLLAVVCGLLMLLVAGPAAAHARLESSDPPDGASLSTPPSTVSLTFNEQMQDGFATVTVIGPDGAPWHDGETQVDGNTVRIAVKPLGPAGVYQIGYRVISDDGHPITGSVSFTLTQPGPGTTTSAPAPTSASATTAVPPAAAPPTEDGGTPVWPFIVAAVVAVAIGAAFALRSRRS
ncbi:hypothetical protein SAMN05443637_11236 [Pseudonocardia thermophila]|uniref:CopC domain-containing protein n=1 Tax=Pseudonocardia thermophila TaxID=1848 RepID=A0A1M6VC71_PSETH|nr:copper resistance CopC family protein [Pseudonocardia thermophila]SHK78971.1 hypothetical protein SAMN05443637_11236 [Pseudonocardia thermophila]